MACNVHSTCMETYHNYLGFVDGSVFFPYGTHCKIDEWNRNMFLIVFQRWFLKQSHVVGIIIWYPIIMILCFEIIDRTVLRMISYTHDK